MPAYRHPESVKQGVLKIRDWIDRKPGEFYHKSGQIVMHMSDRMRMTGNSVERD